jgi:hypothetical protein
MDQPLTKRRVLVGCREGALAAFGVDALALVVSKLPSDVRRDTVEAGGLAGDWLPWTHFVAWHEAVWETAAARSHAELDRWSQARIDYGFGVVHRALMRIATPRMLASRAHALWRGDHSHGDVVAEVAEKSCVVTLTGHPFVEHPVVRASLAEVTRHFLSRIGLRDVTKRYWLDESGPAASLVTRISWG